MTNRSKLSPVEAAAFALALPKAELHVHLEGAISPSLLRALACRSGTLDDLPPSLREGRYEFSDMSEFMAQYLAASRALSDGEAYRQLALEFANRQRRQRILYTEAHMTMAIPAMRSGDWDAPIEGVLQGLSEAGRMNGPLVRLIADVPEQFDRDFPDRRFELREMTLSRALRHSVVVDSGSAGVVAVGVAGEEGVTGFSAYRDMLLSAKSAGLGVILHAGESEPRESIGEALDALSPYTPDRLAHGVTLLDGVDSGYTRSLIEALKMGNGGAGIPLDMAATSNFVLGAVKSLETHPAKQAFDAGVTVTINTDDPSMFSTNLLREYAVWHCELGFSTDELCKITADAWRHSFAPAELKNRALQEIARIRESDSGEVASEYLSVVRSGEITTDL